MPFFPIFLRSYVYRQLEANVVKTQYRSSSRNRVSVISCVSRKPEFHGGSDHDAARTLLGCDTGPGEYSGSAGGFEQGCPTGGHGPGTVGDRHVRATILQTVAPSDAWDCIGHGLNGIKGRCKLFPSNGLRFSRTPDNSDIILIFRFLHMAWIWGFFAIASL